MTELNKQIFNDNDEEQPDSSMDLRDWVFKGGKLVKYDE